MGNCRCQQLFAIVLLAFLGFVLSAKRGDADLFQAPLGPNGTWHLYETEDEPRTWAAASEDAAERTWLIDESTPGWTGTLVSVTSPQETLLVEYLLSSLGVERAWIGLTDREGAAPQIGPPTQEILAPQESAFLADPRSDGWAWTSGEPVDYLHWGINFPRNTNQRTDAVYASTDGRWGDEASGFVTDQPTTPSLQPGTSPDELTAVRLPFLIEYPLGLDQPLAEISAGPLYRMPPQLPGVAAAPGRLGVTDYVMDEAPVSIVAAASQLGRIQAGELTPLRVASGQYQVADLTDPDSTLAGGSYVASQPRSNPSDVAGQREQDIITAARGTLYVEQAGTYSLRVNTSGSFALQIGDHEFQQVRGMGQIDELDPSVLFYADDLLNAETIAVLDLPVGYHELQFITSSTHATHYWEISSAQGAKVDGTPAQWIPLGGDVSFSAKPVVIPALLTEPATVVSLRGEDGGDVRGLAEVRGQVSTADRAVLGTRDDVATVIVRDADGICCRRFGARFQDSYLWPIDEPGKPSDRFASLISGTLLIDDGDDIENELLEVTFAVLADDAADLWIQDASFEAGDFFTDLSAVIDDDVIMRPNSPGEANSVIRASIRLSEGVEYDFEAAHFDGTDDGGFELYSALGRHLDATPLDDTLFFPVSTTIFTDEVEGNEPLSWGPLPGDFDRNGLLDVGDLQLQIGAIDSQATEFDLNGDGVVTLDDLHDWVVRLKSTWVGDANLDGEFNSSDLVAVLAAGRYETQATATWSQGDWNGDQRFSSSDLIVALAGGGYELGPRRAAPAVPEPGVRCLLIAAAMVAAGRRRMR